jgi:hypothetical protein
MSEEMKITEAQLKNIMEQAVAMAVAKQSPKEDNFVCGSGTSVMLAHSESITKLETTLPEIRADIKKSNERTEEKLDLIIKNQQDFVKNIADIEKDIVVMKTEKRVLTGIASFLGVALGYVISLFSGK